MISKIGKVTFIPNTESAIVLTVNGDPMMRTGMKVSSIYISAVGETTADRTLTVSLVGRSASAAIEVPVKTATLTKAITTNHSFVEEFNLNANMGYINSIKFGVSDVTAAESIVLSYIINYE